jgi:hypothetical protein
MMMMMKMKMMKTSFGGGGGGGSGNNLYTIISKTNRNKAGKKKGVKRI